MPNNRAHLEKIFTYIGVSAIVLLLFGLAGWYFFISKQTASIEDAGNARGFSIGIPSFLGSRGSTATNVGGASELTTESGGAGALMRFFGVGEGDLLAETPVALGTPSTEERKAPRFWRVSPTPVAGFAFAASSSKLRYIERANGNVFDADIVTGDVTRITNTLIPRVYEASVGNGTVVLRTLEDGSVKTLSGTIATTTNEGLAALETGDLGASVHAATALPSSSDILMLLRGTSEILVRVGAKGSSPQTLATLPAGDFRIHWVSENGIVLAEKAGSGIVGSAFRAGNPLISLVRDIPGLLVAVAPSGSLLYSADTGSAVALYAQLAGAEPTLLPIATIADKCAWSLTNVAYCAVPQENLGNNFLDRWYRGEMHTVDAWYTIQAGAASAEKLFTMESAGIDVESPVVDPTGTYLAFVNARDKSLWLLRIKE